MTQTRLSDAVVLYAGVVLVLAMILGGGTRLGLWTDHLLQLALLPMIYFAIMSLAPRAFGWVQSAFILTVLALLGLQFMPTTLSFPAELDLETRLNPHSRNTLASIENVLIAVPLFSFFLVVQRMTEGQQKSLLPFVMFGVAINLAIGVIQLSFEQTTRFVESLPYSLLAGFFANPNHFSTLIYCSIPIIAWYFLPQRDLRYGYLALVAVLAVIQSAIGSSAAMGLTVGLCLLCFWVFRKKVGNDGMLEFFGIAAVLIIASVLIVLRDPEVLQSLDRIAFLRASWPAVVDHWPYGSGLGTFAQVYVEYEPRSNLSAQYVNHIHNDFVELAFEGGLLAVIALVLYVVRLVMSFSRNPLSLAAFVAILAVLAHSVVDYPLRTMAIALLFAYFNGIVMRNRTIRNAVSVRSENRAADLQNTPAQ